MPPKRRKRGALLPPFSQALLTGLLQGILVALAAKYVGIEAAAIVAGVLTGTAYAAKSPYQH